MCYNLVECMLAPVPSVRPANRTDQEQDHEKYKDKYNTQNINKLKKYIIT